MAAGRLRELALTLKSNQCLAYDDDETLIILEEVQDEEIALTSPSAVTVSDAARGTVSAFADSPDSGLTVAGATVELSSDSVSAPSPKLEREWRWTREESSNAWTHAQLSTPFADDAISGVVKPSDKMFNHSAPAAPRMCAPIIVGYENTVKFRTLDGDLVLSLS